MPAKKPFFRETNIYRVIGFGFIIAGQFLPLAEFDILGVKGTTNLIQITGFIAVFWPTAKEFISQWSKGQ